jgi:hypothetical protein
MSSWVQKPLVSNGIGGIAVAYLDADRHAVLPGDTAHATHGGEVDAPLEKAAGDVRAAHGSRWPAGGTPGTVCPWLNAGAGCI